MKPKGVVGIVNFKQFRDDLCKTAWNMTVEEAHEQHVCIRCKKAPEPMTKFDKVEYSISALCKPCWTIIVGEE